MNLFEPEELQRAHAHYLAQHAPQTRAKTKTEILLEVVREFPDATVAELAEAAERSKSWVRKQLKQAGIALAMPARRKKVGVQQKP